MHVPSRDSHSHREIGYDAVLRLPRKEHLIVGLDLGGSQRIYIARLQKLSKVLRLTKNVHVLIDSERKAGGDALEEKRRAFIEGCGKLGIRACATNRRAMEHYVPGRAVK